MARRTLPGMEILPLVQSVEPRSGTTRPHAVFVLPELVPVRPTLLILADGNRRGSPDGGYAAGAGNVVRIAEHLARRGDIAALVAAILSPDNVARRSDRFFLEIFKQMMALGVAVRMRGALVSAGVRLDVCGDLAALRGRGGAGAALADGIEAVCALTEEVTRPVLRLFLGVGYGPDAAREVGADLILRTGMEEPGALRLSGLRAGERVSCVGITTLWPDVEPRHVDDVLARWARPSPRLATGHGAEAIAALAVALAGAELAAPVHVTIPSAATAAELSAVLDALADGPLRGRGALAVELSAGGPARHLGARSGALHRLRILAGDRARRPTLDAELHTVLAPGQRPPSFTLPAWLPLGHATAHACAPTAAGIVAGIGAALRFTAAHPALRGGDRPLARTPRAQVDVDPRAEGFAAAMLGWAASAGILLPEAAFQRAAQGYALTAYFIHAGVPAAGDPTGAGWEPRAALSARYMLLVAASDEGVFDRRVAGEDAADRWARLEASARFLQGAIAGEGAPSPGVPGAEILVAVAAQWREILAAHAGTASPATLAGFRAGLADLIAASVAEQRADLAADPFALGRDERAVAALIERRFAVAPAVVAARARALAAQAATPEAADALRVLLYLVEAGSAIGAGLLFRAAALAVPAASVPAAGLAALQATAALLDLTFRLSNDLSGFLDAPGGDRDPKQNACTLLVPAALRGPARATRMVQALSTCQATAGWLAVELAAQVERLAAVWPAMAALVRRGMHVGRRVYEVGHYTTVTPAEMAAIGAELAEA